MTLGRSSPPKPARRYRLPISQMTELASSRWEVPPTNIWIFIKAERYGSREAEWGCRYQSNPLRNGFTCRLREIAQHCREGSLSIVQCTQVSDAYPKLYPKEVDEQTLTPLSTA